MSIFEKNKDRLGTINIEKLEGYIKYDNYLGRTTLPPPGNQPAVVVPLDYTDVVRVEKYRGAIDSVEVLCIKLIEQYRELIKVLKIKFNTSEISYQKNNDFEPFWNNPYYGEMDAKLAMSVIKTFKPKIIMEIGGGNTTKFFRKAIHDEKLNTKIISIDPCPRAEIDYICDEILKFNLLDVPLDCFDRLNKGDILSLDGSHLVFHGSDVPYFFLTVLPLIKEGVYVHIHDIYLPFEYPEECDKLYYNEQYLIAAFLLNNNEWEIFLPTHYLYKKEMLEMDGCSFWLKKKKVS